jgi:hypothetical protein
MAGKSVAKMSDEELDAAIQAKLDAIIAVKEERAELLNEQKVRRALASLDDETRIVARKRLEAGIGPAGSDVT